MNKHVLPSVFFIALSIATSIGWGQGVTIGSNNPPDHSATLDVQSTTGGFLLPRLTTAQRNAINAPAIGLQIFNSSTGCIEVYLTSGWKQITCDCAQPPAQPGNITGPSTFCANQQQVQYTVAPVSDA